MRWRRVAWRTVTGLLDVPRHAARPVAGSGSSTARLLATWRKPPPVDSTGSLDRPRRAVARAVHLFFGPSIVFFRDLLRRLLAALLLTRSTFATRGHAVS